MRITKAKPVAGAALIALTCVITTIPVGSLLTSPASAVDLHKSRLSSIDLKKCRKLSSHRASSRIDGAAWRCAGIKGYPVYFAEGDLRHFLAFGPDPQKRRSATQTLGAFNSIFKGRRRPTIEWRTDTTADGSQVPFATIVRFYTSNEGANGEFLVVTKVDPKDSCQLAVIDARANSDAMAIARAWAIAEARQRPCPDQPEQLGLKGKGPL